jgi:hypothetical protein
MNIRSNSGILTGVRKIDLSLLRTAVKGIIEEKCNWTYECENKKAGAYSAPAS